MSLSIIALAAALQDAPEKPNAPPPTVVAPPIVYPPAPPPPPPPRVIEPTRSRANLASYVSDSDYPLEALMNGEEGTVGFRLTVGPDGRVANCIVFSSSGTPSLDDTTCSIMRRRARFTPARGLDGNPTSDSLSARITWRIDEEPPAPDDEAAATPAIVQRTRPVSPLPDLVRLADYPAEAVSQSRQGRTALILSVGPDGRVASCQVRTSSGSPDLDEAACRLMRERARFTPARDSQGAAVADDYWSHVTWRLQTPPPVAMQTPPPAAHPVPRRPLQSYVSTADYPASALRNREQGDVHFRLGVGADGRVTGCEVLATSGSSALDNAACSLMRRRARFSPAYGPAGAPVVSAHAGRIAWRLPATE